MNRVSKKHKNSTLSHNFLTFTTIFFSIFFTFCFSSNAESGSSNTNTKSLPSTTSNSTEKNSKGDISSIDNPPKATPENEIQKKNETTQKEIAMNDEELAKQKEAFLKQIKELENQRRKLSFEIYQLRVKLIKEDPELQSLQRSIMDMHRKMASKLNQKNSIKVLLDKAKQIDTQIVETINENKNFQSKDSNNDKIE